jgi:hypothetical protein
MRSVGKRKREKERTTLNFSTAVARHWDESEVPTWARRFAPLPTLHRTCIDQFTHSLQYDTIPRGEP